MCLKDKSASAFKNLMFFFNELHHYRHQVTSTFEVLERDIPHFYIYPYLNKQLRYPLLLAFLITIYYTPPPLPQLLYREVSSVTRHGEIVFLKSGELIFYLWNLGSGANNRKLFQCPIHNCRLDYLTQGIYNQKIV